jgi:hypothetical protein
MAFGLVPILLRLVLIRLRVGELGALSGQTLHLQSTEHDEHDTPNDGQDARRLSHLGFPPPVQWGLVKS